MQKLSFKDFIAAHRKENSNIENFIKQHDIVLFFKYKGEVFGCPEESRIVFAKLKRPKGDEDATKEWIKEADFSGFNLKNSVKEQLFTKKDLKFIKIISKEEALKEDVNS